jgi:hypothetical protein
VLGAGIDRVPYGDAAEPERVVDGARYGRTRLTLRERIAVVELQDERDLPRELGRARLEETERGCVRVAPRVDCELEVVERIVRRGIRRERSNRSVFEPLVNGQNDELAGSSELARRK